MSVDPVALGAMRDADLAAIERGLAGPNPHTGELDLPPALTDDGGL